VVLDAIIYCKVAITRGVFLQFAIAISLLGCASGRAYFGYESTDLNGLSQVRERVAVEDIVGFPGRIEHREQGYTAFYIYDRGYVGRLEEHDVATKIMYAPIMAWGELLTLGLLGASLDHCQEACQKGLLSVHYGLSDRLVRYENMELPVDHPILYGCMYNAPSSMVSFCQAIRDMARPLNLPPSYTRNN
jgi:hypothetical protein